MLASMLIGASSPLAAVVVPEAGSASADTAQNGIPVINIVAADGNGISHNFYQSFDVDSAGVVLNNSPQVTQTQLAGYIAGNPNLGGGAATVILNEVISAAPSSLNGYVEVAGKKAAVIIANPYGISCDGCGFINTSRATLTTGAPVFDANGNLSGFAVTDGAVSFNGEGANTLLADRFDVIARSVVLNAEIHARQLNLVTGQQTVDYASLATSNVTTDVGAPAFAIDSSALGGMYANEISLVATEAGVGVRLQAPVASQVGDVVLSAEGDIQFVRLSSEADLNITSQGVVQALGSASADDSLRIDASSLEAQSGTLEGDRLFVDASQLEVGADAALWSQFGTVITADDISNAGTMMSLRDLTLTTQTLDNSGRIISGDDLAISLDNFTYGGVVDALGSFSLIASGDVQIGPESSWLLGVDSTFQVGGTLTNDRVLSSSTSLIIDANAVINNGDIAGKDMLSVTAQSVLNETGARMSSAGRASRGELVIDTPAFTNNGQVVDGSAGAALGVYATDPLDISIIPLPGEHGQIQFAGKSQTYITETRAAYTSYSRYLQSAYLIDRAGWSPEALTGKQDDQEFDAALLDSDSRRSGEHLSGVSYGQGASHLMAMLNNGLYAAEDLPLADGITMNVRQINRLSDNVFGTREREIAGATLRVPVVFWAAGASDTEGLFASSAAFSDSAVEGGAEAETPEEGAFSESVESDLDALFDAKQGVDSANGIR